MVKRAVEMEGTVTVSLPNYLNSDYDQLADGSQGEHGVGLVKRDYLPHELGASTVDAMRKVRTESSLCTYCLSNPTGID